MRLGALTVGHINKMTFQQLCTAECLIHSVASLHLALESPCGLTGVVKLFVKVDYAAPPPPPYAPGSHERRGEEREGAVSNDIHNPCHFHAFNSTNGEAEDALE